MSDSADTANHALVARRSSMSPSGRACPSHWCPWSAGQAGSQRARRKAVQRAAKELGYRPNAAARSLVQQRTHTVGALLSDMCNPWFIDLLESARSELLDLGLNLFLSEVDPRQNNSSVLDAFIEARVDGLLRLGHYARL